MDNYGAATVTRNHIAVVPRQGHHAADNIGMPREDTCNHHFSGVDKDAGMKGMGSQNLGKYQFLIGWSKVSAQQPGGAYFRQISEILAPRYLQKKFNFKNVTFLHTFSPFPSLSLSYPFPHLHKSPSQLVSINSYSQIDTSPTT